MARAKSGGSDAVSLALRIATVALSAASAAVTIASSTQPTAGGSSAMASNASYSDYNSLRYSLAANMISAALQAAAAYLMVRNRAEEAEAAEALAELVDIAAQVLLYSSSAVSFAVDDFGSCGRRFTVSVCKTAGEFCQRVHASGALSMSAAVALSVSLYIKDVPVSFTLEEDEPKPESGCGRGCHCHH